MSVSPPVFLGQSVTPHWVDRAMIRHGSRATSQICFSDLILVHYLFLLPVLQSALLLCYTRPCGCYCCTSSLAPAYCLLFSNSCSPSSLTSMITSWENIVWSLTVQLPLGLMLPSQHPLFHRCSYGFLSAFPSGFWALCGKTCICFLFLVPLSLHLQILCWVHAHMPEWIRDDQMNTWPNMPVTTLTFLGQTSFWVSEFICFLLCSRACAPATWRN